VKITIDKCSQCGRVFEDESQYNTHLAKEDSLAQLQEEFPVVKDDGLRFVNGHGSVQRSRGYCEGYKLAVIDFVTKNQEATDYEPMSYGWFRWLSDGQSMFYSAALRILNICPKCYKEWGQQYYANKCCEGK